MEKNKLEMEKAKKKRERELQKEMLQNVCIIAAFLLVAFDCSISPVLYLKYFGIICRL